MARGGGSEYALSLDLRFASIGRALLGRSRGRDRHHPGRRRDATAGAPVQPRPRWRPSLRL